MTMDHIGSLPDKALSVRQPWAWAIIRGGKRFENRSQAALKHLPVTKPFRVAIHAARGMTREEYEFARDYMKSIDVICPPPAALLRGGIIGTVELVQRAFKEDEPWCFGWGIELRDPVACEFIPAVGALGYFDWRKSLTSEAAPLARWMTSQPVDPKQPTFLEAE